MSQSLNVSSGAVAGQNSLSYLNQNEPAQVLIVRAPRNPTTSDRRYKIGTLWLNTSTQTTYMLTHVASGLATWAFNVPAGSNAVETLTGNSGGAISPSSGNINIVGSNLYSITGSGSTLTVAPTTGGYPITPYVVGASGVAGYTTIQSAINAAHAAGGGVVWVQPGTYTENLTLTGDTEVVGVSGNSDAATAGNCVIISGVHTPPATGSFTFKNIHLQSATDIFNSAAAGSATLVLLDCSIACTNGYTFNMANWTGTLVVYNVGDTSTTNGVVNNTAGAVCFFISGTMGAGTGKTMTTSGSVILQEIDLDCPWTAATGSVVAVDYTIFTQTVTMANNSTGSIRFSTFNTGATAALTMSSTAAVNLMNCIVNSSNSPAIAGSGAGTLTYAGVTFSGSNSSFAGTLTLAGFPVSTGALTSTGTIMGTQIYATADTAGVASTIGLSNTNSSTISTGVGSIKMSSANPATNTGWIKIYIGVTAAWIPTFTTNAP